MKYENYCPICGKLLSWYEIDKNGYGSGGMSSCEHILDNYFIPYDITYFPVKRETK